MDKIKQLRDRKAAIIKQMKAMLDRCDDEARAMSPAENTTYKALDASVDRLNAEIAGLEEGDSRREKVAAEERELHRVVNPLPGGIPGPRSTRDDEFSCLGEFFNALACFKRDGRRDVRLDRAYEIAERREQTMGTGSAGGFAVPTQFDALVRQVNPQEQLVRPRATIIPAGSPPDAQLTFPVLDQAAEQNMYGGVVVTHTGEGVTMTETTFKLREGTLEPKEMSAYLVVTQKLLNNWQAGNAFITQQLRWAVQGAEDYDMLRGSGINSCTGIIGSGAAISYPRAGAGAIAFNDVVAMLSRVKMGGSLTWAASQTVIPQLAAMVDAGNNAVWLGGNGNQGAAANAAPSTLLGFPLMFVDRMPALGSKGDLCLLNLPYYLVKDGSGPIIASSEHILFLSNKVVFKIVWNVDGRPWLTEPIQLEGSAANTVSPFVVLA